MPAGPPSQMTDNAAPRACRMADGARIAILRIKRPRRGHPERTPMLAVIAAVLFVLAFLFNLVSTSLPNVLSPTSLMLAGLACLALHQAGFGHSTVGTTSRT